MRLVRWRAQNTILTVLTLVLLGAGIWHAAVTKSATLPVRAAAAPPDHPPSTSSSTVYATVGSAPAGSAMPSGFLGLSLEYSALEAYTGADPAALDPVFVHLLRNLGQPLTLRIGGNSTDATWWPVPGMSRPRGIGYALTPGWLASARALAGALGAKLILGLNLAAADPRLTATEAQALLSGVGPENVSALELGNEPDVYGVFPWYRDRRSPVFARSAGYGLQAFIADVRRSIHLLPSVAMAGPATAELPLAERRSRPSRGRARPARSHRPPLPDPGMPQGSKLPLLSLDRQPAEQSRVHRPRAGAGALRRARPRPWAPVPRG